MALQFLPYLLLNVSQQVGQEFPLLLAAYFGYNAEDTPYSQPIIFLQVGPGQSRVSGS